MSVERTTTNKTYYRDQPGKGSWCRPRNKEAYDRGYERVFGHEKANRRPGVREIRTNVGGRIIYSAGGGRRTSTGEVSGVSFNAGVMPHQVEEANRMMAKAGLGDKVRFDPDGNMHWRGRDARLKALKLRGLHDNDEIRG